jgi:hypothetical protein
VVVGGGAVLNFPIPIRFHYSDSFPRVARVEPDSEFTIPFCAGNLQWRRGFCIKFPLHHSNSYNLSSNNIFTPDRK